MLELAPTHAVFCWGSFNKHTARVDYTTPTDIPPKRFARCSYGNRKMLQNKIAISANAQVPESNFAESTRNGWGLSIAFIYKARMQFPRKKPTSYYENPAQSNASSRKPYKSLHPVPSNTHLLLSWQGLNSAYVYINMRWPNESLTFVINHLRFYNKNKLGSTLHS